MVTISPGIQQMQQAMMGTSGAAGSAEDLFERSFSDMAYEGLQQKAPDLLDHVVTYRILVSEMDKGFAVGAFLVSRNNHVSYVPAVLSDNKIKPMEIIYSKDLSKFLPLTDKWLNEIGKVEDQPLGEAAELPTNVRGDVSLRHLLNPPYVGRYGFASAADLSPEEILDDLMWRDEGITEKIGKLLDAAFSYDYDTSKALVEKALKTNRKLAEFYLEHFDGPRGVAEYFYRGQSKVAEQVTEPEPEFIVVPHNAKLGEFRRIFGEDGPSAYQMALQQGYAVKEALDRETRDVVITHHGKADLKETVEENSSFAQGQMKTLHPVQYNLNLEYPMDNGFYRVYTPSGKTHEVFVLTDRDNFAPIRGLQTDGARHTIIYADGSYATCYDAAGTPLTKAEAESSKVWGYLKRALSGSGVKRGKGFFVKLDREDKFEFFGPVEITKVYTSNKDTRAETLDGYEIILQKQRDRGGKIHWRDSKYCALDNKYRFVPLSRKRDDRYLKLPNDISQAFSEGILKQAALQFDMSYEAPTGNFYINRREHSKLAAVNFLLSECKMAAALVPEFLAEVQDKRTVRAVAVDGVREKVASIFGPDAMDPSMMGGMDPAMAAQMGGGMDPSMMGGMDPSMMGGMDPAMAAQMGGDPSMMGMDPSMMGQPGSGVTTGDELEQPEINPQFSGDPSLLQDPEIMQMAHLDIIIRSPTLKDIVAQYEDTILEALDHWGRILFAVYVKSPDLRDEIGNMQYMALENGVRNLFRSTGETILDLHQNTAILSRSLASPISDMQTGHTTKSSM